MLGEYLPSNTTLRTGIRHGDRQILTIAYMTEGLKKQEVSLRRSQALEMLDTSERKEQTIQLIDDWLPRLAVDIENHLHEQEARVLYDFFSDNNQSKIRVVLKLKKLEHEFLIHLDSQRAMFVIGSERSGEEATSALSASMILKSLLMKFKTV